jgi:hypothetical protein
MKLRENMRCPSCENGKLLSVEDLLSNFEGYVFVEKGFRCASCAEEFVPEEEGQKTIAAARKLGLWGEQLKLYRKLVKTAKGIILRIPNDMQRNLRLTGDEEIAISKVGRKLVIDISPKS